jgi:hypothetical protein
MVEEDKEFLGFLEDRGILNVTKVRGYIFSPYPIF